MAQFNYNIFQPNIGLVVTSFDNHDIINKTQEYIFIHNESGIVNNIESIKKKLLSYFDVTTNLYIIMYVGSINDNCDFIVNNEPFSLEELLKMKIVEKDLLLILVDRNSHLIFNKLNDLNTENLYIQSLSSLEQLDKYWHKQNNENYEYNIDKNDVPKYYKPTFFNHKWNNFKNILFIGNNVIDKIINYVNSGTMNHNLGKCYPCSKYRINKLSCKFDKYCKYCHHSDHEFYKKDNQIENFKKLKCKFNTLKDNNFQHVNEYVKKILLLAYNIQNIINEELKKLEDEYIIRDDISLIIILFSDIIRDYGEKIRNCIPSQDIGNFYNVVQNIKILRSLNKRCIWISGIIHNTVIKIDSKCNNKDTIYLKIYNYITELIDKIKNTIDEWFNKRLYIFSLCKKLEDKYILLQKINIIQIIQNTLKYKTVHIDDICYYLDLLVKSSINEIECNVNRFEELIIILYPDILNKIPIHHIYINIYSVNKMRGISLHWKNIIDSWCIENEAVQKLVDFILYIKSTKKNTIVNILDSIIYLDYVNCVYNNKLIMYILEEFKKIEKNDEYLECISNITGYHITEHNKITTYLYPQCMFIYDLLCELKKKYLEETNNIVLTKKIYAAILRELRIFPEIIHLITSSEDKRFFDIQIYLYSSTNLEMLLDKLKSLSSIKK